MTQLLNFDNDGYLVAGGDIFTNEGDVIPEGYTSSLLPTDENGNQFPFHRPKWTGTEWVEDMPQAEIDELNKPIVTLPTDTEILGQQMTEREIESMLQGQQITDMELRMLMLEMEAS